MKLGDKVLFDRYYRKNGDSVSNENMNKEQEKEFEENEQVVLARLDEVQLKNTLEGIVVGKRKMIKSTTYGLGTSRYNPDGDDTWGTIASETVDVYLIATTMSGFHRVPEEWLQSS